MIRQDKNISNPWDKLDMPSIGNVSMLRVDANNKHDVFYAKDPSNKYMLFFFVKEFPKYTRSVELNGVEVALLEISNKKAMVLTLKNNQDWELFLHVLGLMGELLFLDLYLLPKYDPLEAMAFWTGPDGDVQDFSIDNKRIEIKTCASPSKNEVKISSAQQLYSANCQVFLSVVYLMPSVADHSGAFSLYKLAKRIADKIKDKTVAYELFIQKLASVGMFVDDVYDDDFMVCNGIKFFDVNKDFPKITPDILPDAINKVVYTISLNMASGYEVSHDKLI